MVGELPYLAIDGVEAHTIAVDENTTSFSGHGTVVTPYMMIEISGENKFSGHSPIEHYYVSNLPLYDENYWILYLKAENVLDKSDEDDPFYHHGEVLASDVDFTLYYAQARKPLYMDRINLNNRSYPYITLTQQTLIGPLPHVEIAPLQELDGIYSIDTKTEDKTNEEIETELSMLVDIDSHTEDSNFDYDDPFDISDIWDDITSGQGGEGS